MMRWIVISFLLVFVVNACTIEKRLYNRGFHIAWHKQHPRVSSDAERKKLSEIENHLAHEKHEQIVVKKNTNSDTLIKVAQVSLTSELIHEKELLNSSNNHSNHQCLVRKSSRIPHHHSIQNDPDKDEKASMSGAVFSLILGLAALIIAVGLLYLYTIESTVILSFFLIFSSVFFFVLAPVLFAIGMIFLMDRNYIRKHKNELKQRTINNNSLRKKQLEQGDTSSIYARLIMGILIIGLFVTLFFYTTNPLLLVFSLIGLSLIIWSVLDWVKFRKLHVEE